MFHTIPELWEKQSGDSIFTPGDNIMVFIADDSTTICSLINTDLIKKGYKTEVFTHLDSLKNRVNIAKPDILLLDFYFQDTTSVNFIEKYAKSIPIICMSTTENNDELNQIFSYGIVDFIPKPLNMDILSLKINNFTNRIFQLRDFETIQYFIDSLLYTIEIRDIYTRGHSERVSLISEKIAIEMKLSDEQIHIIKRGALLHDIGKVGVRDSVLLKAGRLDDNEFTEIKNHTIFGYNVCKNLNTFKNYLNIIRSHHEKLDGSGYPDGLKGDELSIEVKIVSVADVFDALTSKRVYRDALSYETAFKILFEEYQKGYWDLDIITALRNIYDKGLI